MVDRSAQHVANRDDWETPPEVFGEIQEVFGGRLALDVAASDQNTLCPKYFTAETDALKQSWDPGPGKMYWLNCPYSLKGEFLCKAQAELKKGNEGLLLLPSSQEAGWFREYVTYPNLSRMVWPGRVQYLIGGKRMTRVDKKTGKVVNSGNTGGSVVVAFTRCRYLPRILGEPWVGTVEF